MIAANWSGAGLSLLIVCAVAGLLSLVFFAAIFVAVMFIAAVFVADAKHALLRALKQFTANLRSRQSGHTE
jgi:hypothetical protein